MGHKGRPPSTPSRIDGLSSPSYGELGGDEGSFVSSFTARTDNTKAARSGQGPEVGGKMTRFEDGSSSGENCVILLRQKLIKQSLFLHTFRTIKKNNFGVGCGINTYYEERRSK